MRRPNFQFLPPGVVPDARLLLWASVTAVTHGLAAAVSPIFAGWLLTLSAFALASVICGGLKIVYDLWLLSTFRRLRPPEEST